MSLTQRLRKIAILGQPPGDDKVFSGGSGALTTGLFAFILGNEKYQRFAEMLRTRYFASLTIGIME